MEIIEDIFDNKEMKAMDRRHQAKEVAEPLKEKQ